MKLGYILNGIVYNQYFDDVARTAFGEEKHPIEGWSIANKNQDLLYWVLATLGDENSPSV